MRKTLSVAIITQDEAANLERTLSTIAWADEIVIVDSGSSDRSEEVARRFNARFYDEPWKGFAAQKNSALEKCACDWILPLNAGEALSEGLADQVRGVLNDESARDGYAMGRRYYFLGHRMRFGGLSRDPALRMFRRGSAEFEPGSSRERLHFVGKCGLLKDHLAYHGYSTLYAYIQHMAYYDRPGDSPAEELSQQKPGILSFAGNALLNPIANFVYNYILRLGFLDGREGLLLHIYESVYMSWKYAKAWETSRGSNSQSSEPSVAL